MMSLEKNILSVESKIDQALIKSGRTKDSVTLVAVSKRQSIAAIQKYCNFQTKRNKTIVFGENYVQEFRDKRQELPSNIEAHLIGPLQRNKVKLAVSLFDVIETVDSERLLAQIDKEAAKIDKIQRVYLQTNISSDQAKSGFLIEEFNVSLLKKLASYPNIKLEGLMTITRLYAESQEVRNDFIRLTQLGREMQTTLSLSNSCLSMGMSDDFEIAIEEGATHVRIGSALFGMRNVT